MLAYNNVRVEVESNALLGECPVWDAEKQLLYWLDIKGKTLNRFSTKTNLNQALPLCIEVGSIAIRTGGSLVAATRDGFAYMSDETGVLTAINDPERHFPNNRFNDGSIDHAGNFIAGTMDDFEKTQPVQFMRWVRLEVLPV